MEHNVRIPTSDGVKLAAQVWWPPTPTTAETRAAAAVGVVVSHPYGPLGGNMHNNVVEAVYDAMRRLGHAVVRFNFRGVGGSTGRGSWRGTGEMEDVRSVCAYLLSPPAEGAAVPAVPVTRIVLVGYSFGAAVSASVMDARPEIVAYAGIAFPFSVLWALTLFNGGTVRDAIQRSPKPKLFVQGDQDNFTSKGSFDSALAAVAPTAEVQWLERADHFFFGREAELVRLVDAWLQRTLAALPTSVL